MLACHVVPEFFGIRPLFPHLRELDREQAESVRKAAATVLDEQIARVLGPGPGRLEVRIEAGSPHSAVLEIASEVGAGLIVIGHEASSGAGLFEGVGERVARHSDCPVLIASKTKGDVVLAATDFSDPALPAVHLAQEEAGRRKLPMVIIHAIDLHVAMRSLSEILSPSTIERAIEAYREEARQRVSQLGRRVGSETRIIVREGPPAEEILSTARETRAELLVIGTHGRSGLGRIALGSVAEAVLRGADCSTLVVRLQK
jgi:nucleotide-binding universal stress UspA family protein